MSMTELDARLTKYMTFYLTIELETVTFTFAEHPIPNLTVTGYGLTVESTIGSKVELFKGRASLSEATFRLANLNGQVRTVLSKDILNSKVTIKQGYKDESYLSYRTTSTGYVASAHLEPDGSFVFAVRDYRTLLKGDLFNFVWGAGIADAMTTAQSYVQFTTEGMVKSFDHETNLNWLVSPIVTDYEFPGGQYLVVDSEIMRVTNYDDNNEQIDVARGALGTQAAKHGTDAQVSELLVFKGHPIELMLYCLETGPTGINGSYDLGIPDFGFDLDGTLINGASFLDYVHVNVPNFNISEFEFWLTGPEGGTQFLEDELLKMTLGYLIHDALGRVRFRCFDIPPKNGWPVTEPATLTEENILAKPKWVFTTDYLYNDIEFGFDYNPVTGDYGVISNYRSQDSVDIYNTVNKFQLMPRGLRMINADANGNGYEYMLDLMGRVFDWSLQSIPMIELNTHMTRILDQPGDRTTLSHRLLPNLQPGGDFDEDVTIINKQVDYRNKVIRLEAVQSDMERRFSKTQDLVLSYTIQQEILENSENSDVLDGYDIFYYPPTLYAGSDKMLVTFSLTASSYGSVDIAVRWMKQAGHPAVGIVLITLDYTSPGGTFPIWMPNFREGINILKFDWYDHSGTNASHVYVDSILYYNDNWEYVEISP